MSFSFVESYIKSHKASSGGKPISGGFMYFLESFVHDLNGELKHFIIFWYYPFILLNFLSNL